MSSNLLPSTMSLQEKLPVMGRAISSSKVFFVAKDANSSFCAVFSCMSGLIGKFKILNSIVSLNFIQMMNNLFRSKVSSKMFFHNQTMLSNISISINKRVGWTPYHSVPTISHHLSSFPMRVFASLKLSFTVTRHTFLSFKPSFFISRTGEGHLLPAIRAVIFNHNHIII